MAKRMATEALKQETDNDGFVTDETEVTVVGDVDLGAHLVQPGEDNGRRQILKGQKKLAAAAGVEQHDDAPPTQAPAYETPRVKTLRRTSQVGEEWRQTAAEAAWSW